MMTSEGPIHLQIQLRESQRSDLNRQRVRTILTVDRTNRSSVRARQYLRESVFSLCDTPKNGVPRTRY